MNEQEILIQEAKELIEKAKEKLFKSLSPHYEGYFTQDYDDVRLEAYMKLKHISKEL